MTAYFIATQWNGLGAPMFVVTTGLLSCILVVAPLRQPAPKRRFRVLPSLAGACMLLSLLSEIAALSIDLTLGPLRYADILLFSAYAFLGCWLLLITRLHTPRRDATPYLDAAATALGVLITLWTFALGALAEGSSLPSSRVIAAYPTTDVLLLATAVRLALRPETLVPALRWLIVTFALLATLDISNSLYTLMNGDSSALLFSGQVFVTLGFALAASDRSLSQLWAPSLDEAEPTSDPRRTALLLLNFAPVLVALILPTSSNLDAIVRLALSLLLLVVLVARIWIVLSSLTAWALESGHRAHHDHLTGLRNRAAVMDLLSRRLRRDARMGTTTAVMFIDVDRLKYVNDTFGHSAGDTIIKHVARTVPPILRGDDVLGRIGGDEFVALATVRSQGDAERLADRILGAFASPVTVAPSVAIRVTPSIGIALGPSTAHGPEGPPETAQSLVDRADRAMYEAKRAGRGRWAVDDGEPIDGEVGRPTSE